MSTHEILSSGATRYTQFELIGQGVSAKVYRALDTLTNSPVAVKVLNPHLRTDEISLERFRRESQITRYLNHPQVVSVFDLIQGESLALVMEYVPGYDLKDYLKLHAPLDAEQALGFLTQILEVLAVCHRKNVVHRDLKPQNVIVGPDGRLKLLDFGIARMTSLADLTQTGTSLGSPEYMAPELFAANVFDPRTDLYAAGVIAYEMLTGELPFQGDSVASLFHQHVNAPVPRISPQRAGIPAWLDDLIAKLLAKKAYERYQAAEEALADIAGERVISKSFPEVRRRDCLRCSRPTLADLPICTFCGYDRVDAFDKGEHDVLISPEEDPRRLRDFLETVFRFKGELPRRPDQLITGIDRLSAEIVKNSAFAHGIYLTIRKRPPHVDAIRVGSSYLLVISGLALLGTVPMLRTLIYASSIDSTGILWAAIVTPVVVAWGAVNLFRLTHRKPVLASDRHRSPPDLTLPADLRSEHEWLRELVPLVGAIRTEDQQIVVSRLIEKYYLLCRHAPDLDGDLRQRLQLLIKSAAQVAGLVSELETTVNDTTLAEWSREYSTSSARAAQGPPEHREAYRRRATAAASRLRIYYDLDFKKAPLTARLIHLQYAFDSLLGRALVFHAAIGEAETGYLEDSIAALERDVGVCREIRQELAELT